MKKLFLFLLCTITLNVFSQRETDNWYFGDKAALKFNYYDTPATLQNNAMQAKYGTASISDKNGNLLLYTSGSFVYNKEHFKMENGDLLASDNEVLQSSIVIPKPNNTNIYYLITLKNSNKPPKLGPLIPAGLYYSVIDMSENDGLGKVIDKNISLTHLASEKLTAVHAKDGKSIWVISFGKKVETDSKFDTFYSFKIDENGVSTTPIISSISSSIINNKGAIKAAPNGEFLLLSNTDNAILTAFDAETGKINSREVLRIAHGEGMASISSRPLSYGVEFSQDSKYIYVETIDRGDNIIFQYNTENLSKRKEVHYSNNPPNYMQLAKDGNIYITTAENERNGGDYLSKISPPKNSNETLATYTENTINLNGKKSNLGLPNFIQSYFRTRIITENGCLNNNTFFEVDSYANITAAEWNFGDGTTSTEITPNHMYSSPGAYKVTATITINNRQITVNRNIIVFPPPIYYDNEKITQCDLNNDGIDRFNLNSINNRITDVKLNYDISFFEDYNDAFDNNISNKIIDPENYENGSNPQELYARVLDDNGCFSIATFSIESIFIQLNNISNSYICERSKDVNNNPQGSINLSQKRNEIRSQLNIDPSISLKFYPDSNSAQTERNELDDDFITATTTIWVRVSTASGCGGIKPFNLFVNTKPITNINDSYIICLEPSEHSPIFLDGNSFNDRYEWRNSLEQIISTQKEFLLNSIGTFSLTAFKTENGIECSSYKKFNVVHPKSAEFNQITVDTETDNNTIFVNLNGNSNYQFSLDNKTFFGNGTDYTFNNVTPGLLTIYVKDINNCEPSIQTNATVIGFKKFFTPNGDGYNDYWNLKGLNSAFFKSIKIFVFDRYGKVIHSITDFNSLGWDGIYNGKFLTSNSYWFTAEIADLEGNLIKKTGNFTLIRN